ncbi:uroporphyrinogen decarboxylase [Anoplophora glabripennis]|uniref:uroporphyrinogen decarboxylase n=1 Tax=Anoplophora glabripennis TaxID=217634 RepID=UPI00087500F5|nr:uroporphyrinogen decarboxylase [Anoplophora glabripennis]XP_018565016.1 uroporphyrinogen decarboxylase [Anoplophora glabripennis]
MTIHNFPVLKNNRILKAVKGEKPDKLPIWIMRQAGRYLPEFMEFRKQHSFFEICQNPALACEVTLMPIRRYDLDASIIFSDILVIPQALGMTVEMKAGVGPVLPEPLTLENIKELKKDSALSRLKYVGEAITLTRHKLEGKVPLFGFSGAPWTLMGYMIEGGGSKTLSKAKKWLYAHPEKSHLLLSLLTDVIIDYLIMQIEAGAQLIQVFDSSAEYLNKSLYEKFCLPYLKKIAQKLKSRQAELHEDVPLVLFAKGAHFCLEEQADLGYDVLGIDWTLEPKFVRSVLKNKNITLQGNLDPCALYAPKEDIIGMAKNMIAEYGTERYIVNLGHGIYPDTPLEAVKAFIEAVHSVKL